MKFPTWFGNSSAGLTQSEPNSDASDLFFSTSVLKLDIIYFVYVEGLDPCLICVITENNSLAYILYNRKSIANKFYSNILNSANKSPRQNSKAIIYMNLL